MGLLDFIFPKYCVYCRKLGDYLCPNCFIRLSFDVKKKCLACDKSSINGLTHPGCLKANVINGSFSAISYNSVAKKLLYQFKYRPYLLDLQKMLTDLMEESLIQNEEFNNVLKENPLIVFIPLHPKKQKKRGYNQVELLAKGLSTKFHLDLMNVLVRTRQTDPQFGLKKEQRKENVKDVFEIKKQETNLKKQTILLVDDVLTTGSTLLEGAKILKKAGASRVYGLTLAMD